MHVACSAYNFIYAVEMRATQQFLMSHASTGSKVALLQADGNVLRKERNEADAQWITLCSFSFWIEVEKTTIQKSRSLRKGLLSKVLWKHTVTDS